MGMAIGASLGEVLEVDVADTGVQWGKCLWVCVSIDVSRKLIRGKGYMVKRGWTEGYFSNMSAYQVFAIVADFWSMT